MLDDASRFIPVISARSSEREADMLELLLQGLRGHGKPDGIYVDNGATYRGKALALVCSRLGIALVHAQPYDALARGKMQRFWRTLREGCLDFIGELSSLHEIQLRLLSFLDAHYHRAAHAGVMNAPAMSIVAALTRPAHRHPRDTHHRTPATASSDLRGNTRRPNPTSDALREKVERPARRRVFVASSAARYAPSDRTAKTASSSVAVNFLRASPGRV